MRQPEGAQFTISIEVHFDDRVGCRLVQMLQTRYVQARSYNRSEERGKVSKRSFSIERYELTGNQLRVHRFCTSTGPHRVREIPGDRLQLRHSLPIQ